MKLKDVEKLAELARIEISEEEKKSLLEDLQGILKYIDQIQTVEVPKEEIKPALKNIFREDKEPHAVEIFTNDLLIAAPRKQDGYVKVRKIL